MKRRLIIRENIDLLMCEMEEKSLEVFAISLLAEKYSWNLKQKISLIRKIIIKLSGIWQP